MSSSPVLLTLCFNILRKMLESKSFLMSIDKNPVLESILKKTFYAQFCVGEKKDEVVRNTDFARTLGYGGILFEYALEVLGGSTPTAEETKQEIEVWRKGMLQSVDMAREGDFVGLKYVLHAPHWPFDVTNNRVDGLASVATLSIFFKTRKMPRPRCGMPSLPLATLLLQKA